MTITPPSTRPGSSSDLILVLHVSLIDGLPQPDLFALADALREAAGELAPGAITHTRVNPTNQPLVIDLPAREVLLTGQRVPLSHTEFEVLARLAHQPRVVVSRAELLEHNGWSIPDDHGARSVDVHVSRVRNKLGRFRTLITTVRGTGYRYDPDPRVHVVDYLVRRTA